MIISIGNDKNVRRKDLKMEGKDKEEYEIQQDRHDRGIAVRGSSDLGKSPFGRRRSLLIQRLSPQIRFVPGIYHFCSIRSGRVADVTIHVAFQRLSYVCTVCCTE